MKKVTFISFCLIMAVVLNLQAAFTPVAGEKYYIVQNLTTTQNVIGAVGTQPTVSNADYVNSQLFEFVSTGTADTYYIKNADGKYLNKSTSDAWTTIYQDAINGTSSTWVISGSTFDNIRLSVTASAYLASDATANGSALYCNKANNAANGLFKLVKASDVYQNNFVDGSFESARVGAMPLGTWVNDKSASMGGGAGSRILSNGMQTVGNNCFYLRFRTGTYGYNSISTHVSGLKAGATYQFSFDYKQDGALTAADIAKVFAAAIANASVTSAISNAVYTTETTTDITTAQPVKTGTFSFVASATDCYIVFANNNANVSAEFNMYIDNLRLVKTAEPQPAIITSVGALTFDSFKRTQKISVSGTELTDPITIAAPLGITVDPATLPATANGATVTVTFTEFASISDNIVFTSGSAVKNLPVTATFAAPSLTEKEMETVAGDVISASATTNITSATDARNVTKIDLATMPTEYSIEVKAKVNSSAGRGLDIEARDASKNGFRIAANTTNLSDYALANAPASYVTQNPIGTDFHVYRYAVKDGKVNIYIDKEYVATKDLTAGMKKNNMIDNGGFEDGTSTGWTSPTGWGVAVIDNAANTGTHSLQLGAWHGQVLVTQYQTNVDAGNYEFKFKHIKLGGSNYRWGLSLDNNTTYLAGPWDALASTTWADKSVSFSAPTDGTPVLFSAWEWNNGTTVALDDVELTEAEDATILPYLSFGKAFGKGDANIDVEYVNYDLSGAYAPFKSPLSITTPSASASSVYYANGQLTVENAQNQLLQVYSVTGALLKSIHVNGTQSYPVNLNKGAYIAKMGSRNIKFLVK